MKILREKDTKSLQEPIQAVVTLGMFDGVHRGHVEVLRQLRALSEVHYCRSVVISFDEHPAKILRGLEYDFILTTEQEKWYRLEQTGYVDILYILESKPSLFTLEANNFLEKYIFPPFRIKQFLMGHDSKFGRDRLGDIGLLQQVATTHHFSVAEAHLVLSKDNKKINSTKIRELLKSSLIKEANDMLGYSYTLNGIVVMGDQRGRKIGFPTANIDVVITKKLIPINGVYAVQVNIHKNEYQHVSYQGMMNIGVRPTFDVGTNLVVEVHILDFDDDIYGTYLSVHVEAFIRPEYKFEDVAQLIHQLHEDKQAVKSFLKK